MSFTEMKFYFGGGGQNDSQLENEEDASFRMMADRKDEAFITILDLIEEYMRLRKSMDEGFREAFLELARLNRSESGRLAVAALSAPPQKNPKEQQGDSIIQILASKYGCAEEETGGESSGLRLGFSRDLQACTDSFGKVLERARRVADVVIRLQAYMHKVQ